MNNTIDNILNGFSITSEEANSIKEDVVEYKRLKMTPLLIAVHIGNISATKFLLENGADICYKDELINKTDIDYIEDGIESIHYAAKNGDVQIFKILESFGADINKQTTGSKMTPFFYAIASKNFELVKYISTKLIDLNQKMGANYNAINYALSSFSTNEIIEYLIQLGVNVNNVGAGLWTPLLSSVAKERYDIAELLIQNNADVKSMTEAKWDIDHLTKDKIWLERIKTTYSQSSPHKNV